MNQVEVYAKVRTINDILSHHIFNSVLAALCRLDNIQGFKSELSPNPDLEFIRPATKDECKLLKTNTPIHASVCPCIFLFKKSLFIINIPDVSFVGKIPTYNEWLNSTGECRLCGIPIVHKEGFCCLYHKTLFSTPIILDIIKQQDLRRGIFYSCTACSKEAKRSCKCGQRYCSRSCQRFMRKHTCK